ncbi:MAG: hypothetical protein UV05_C0005G0006 [candidate division CPR1 bacterium GW2011_GWA2_42_17]|uniref:Uncharacterized protein n=1 Tax=candidate division CPR1 bacterium GW2011_GWA2_42_17 TaxID=1618341 RepID=A0A0G0Z782_9BACT|nr:MAG: hypothetical protein UV05_C0005G0006 [candidate division CPR1 bacterium GW2011_GWA2_42_17]
MHFTASAITQDRWDKSGFGCAHLGKNNKELIFGLSCPSFNEALWKQGLNFFNIWLDKPNVNLESILSLWNGLLDEIKAEEAAAFCLTGEDHDVAFSLLGEAGLYFLQPIQISPIIEGKQPKRFSQVFRGSLVLDSLLIGGTYAMMRLIPQETVKELFRRSHSQNECSRLSQEMSRRYDFTLPLITVAASPEEAQIYVLPQPRQTQVVIDGSRPMYESTRNLNKQQPPRSRILNKNNIMIAWPKIKKSFDYLKKQSPKLTTVLKAILTGAILTGKYIYIFAEILIRKTSQVLLALFKVVVALIHPRKTWPEKKDYIKWKILSQYSRIKNWYRALPKMSQISIVLAVIVTGLLIYSLASLAYSNRNAATVSEINLALNEIDAKSSSAKAALIYDDTDRARALTTEALAVLSTLKNNKNLSSDKYSFWERDLNSLLEQTEKLTTIEKPAQIYALNETAPRLLTLWKGNILGLESAGGKLFIYNIKAKTLQANQANELKGAIKILNDGQNIFVVKPQEILRLQLSPFTVEKTELNKTEPEPFAAIDTYTKRLYAVLAQVGKITRYDKTLAGFGKGLLWGNQTYAALKNGVSLAVDGALFILTSEGKVINCQNGTCADLNIKTPDLALLKPDEIYTSATSKFLFLLSRTKNRLIILTKQGKVVAQYTSPAWTDTQSAQIDETAKKAYLVANNNIYMISLEGLK